MRFPALLALLGASLISAPAANRDERVEWFRDAGFGLFIHWSLDSQIGSTISHTLVGASEDYIQRFLQLPRSFNPHKFEPRDWAVLARLAGFRYVVFTAKHHSPGAPGLPRTGHRPRTLFLPGRFSLSA